MLLKHLAGASVTRREAWLVFVQSGTVSHAVKSCLVTGQAFSTQRIGALDQLFAHRLLCCVVVQESERLISTVLSVQPRMSHTAGAVSNDDMVASVAQDTLANLPAPLAREDASIAKDPFAPLPTGGLTPCAGPQWDSVKLLEEAKSFLKNNTLLWE